MRFILKYFFIIGLFIVGCGSDDNGNDIPTDDTGLQQENRPPSDFDLISILDATSNADLFPVFEWQAANDPDGDSVIYDIFLDQTTNPQALVAEGINGIEYQLTDRLKRNARYSWKVTAKDGKGGVSESDIFTFETRDLQIPNVALTDQASFSPRATLNQMVVEFKEKLWFIGGDISGNSIALTNKIWVSEDGNNWASLGDAPFSSRRGFTLTVYDDRLWLIGGLNNNNIYTSEIWFTEDGVNWDFDINGAANRWGHSTVVFDNKLWIYGGIAPLGNTSADSNDILVSTNGLDWSLPISSQKYSPRAFHDVVVLNDRVYLMGGLENNSEIQKINDVWASTDGATWAKVADFDGSILERTFYDVVALDNRLWLFGGREQGVIPGVDDIYYNDIWVSADGTLWTAYTNNGNYTSRAFHDAVIFEGNIFLIGGLFWDGNQNQLLQDVWKFE